MSFPVAGFRRNRNSDRLRIVHELPNLLQQIKDKYLQNAELDAQLSALHGILQVSKEENMALEVIELKHLQLKSRKVAVSLPILPYLDIHTPH